MRWEAANIKEQDRSSQDGSTTKSKSSETVEAALARLTKSYSAAMNCIGSLHRLASLPQQNDTEASIQRVANAARTTLERSVLIDPLICISLAPTWHEQVANKREEERWAFVHERRPQPASLTSSSHQSTVRELAYLSLVNYADLLVKACSPPSTAKDENGILDKGVVPHTPPLSWNDEDSETTIRLAVAALCDASQIDGSDPTLWLKLACAARRLTILSDKSYDRLTRHALEQGRIALPPDVPPNRLIVNALAQYSRQQESCKQYPSQLRVPEETPFLILDLPRYSWSMLGRMLLRACREGSDYRSHYYSTQQMSSTKQQQVAFGSPCIVLRLSHMLMLPSEVLGNICQYLDRTEVWKFEATCRALSASILSARVSMERTSRGNSVAQERRDNQEQQPSNDTTAAASTLGNASAAAGTSEEPSVQQNNVASGQTSTSTTLVAQQSTAGSGRQTSGGTASESEAARSQRTSKRVQSKLITSGKLAERKAKRNSVEFCFLATLFGCTKDDERYQAALKEEINWDDPIPGNLQILSSNDQQSPTKAALIKQQYKAAGVSSRMGDASLSAFVKRWSAKNSGPLDILSHYLAHIAVNVEQVFSVDSDSSVSLPPFVIDCIDTLLKRSGSPQGLVPSWYGTSDFRGQGNVRALIEVFAMNLLNAELRLRMCERVAFCTSDYDNDGTVVAALVPELLRAANELESTFPTIEEDRDWLSLKVRLHWLASGFFFWWSRVSQSMSESREAELRGLEHVEEAIQCLKLPEGNPIESVRTPQLESPARSESHWKVLSEASLTLFRDELQASSVVSVARERFMEEMEQMAQRVVMLGESDSREVTDSEKSHLAEIGSDLVGRYDIPEEGTNRKLLELIDDFLERHGDSLPTNDSSKTDDASTQQEWGNVWDLLPSSLPNVDNLVLFSSSPSILSVLGICMHAMDGNKLYLLSLLSHLALTGYEHLGTLLQKASGTALPNNEIHDDDGDFSDTDDSLASSNEDEKDMEKKEDEIRVQQYAKVIQFIIDKIRDIYENANIEEVAPFPSSKECLALLHFSSAFSADWYGANTDKTTVLSLSLDFDMFTSTQKLVRSLVDSQAAVVEQNRSLESVFFCGLARILISQRKELPSILRPSNGKRMGRAVRQKVCLNRAGYVGAVASEMAYMLSETGSQLIRGEMNVPHLVRGLSLSAKELDEETRHMSPSSFSRLASLSETVLWLWKCMAVHESDETYTVRLSGASGASSFDRPIIEALYAPVASLFVGLCGAGVGTQRLSRKEATSMGGTDQLCVSEFYDSDSSATALALDTDGHDDSADKSLKAELHRRVCHAAHCIALVSGELNTKVATSFQTPTREESQNGPHFPLVVSRVANHFADILLSEFASGESPELKRKNLWAAEYPVGVRSIGGMLDFALYKAYRALHGLSLTGANAQQAIIGVNHLAESNDVVNPSQTVKPESTLAAARLYRCLLRASGTLKRKSPSKEALEFVASALPAMEESERSKVIRSFVFSGEDYFSHRDVAALLNKDPEHVQPIAAMPDWVWETEASPASASDARSPISREMEDALLVRKGICHELAQGPPPSFSASATDGTKTSKGNSGNQSGKAEERVVAAGNEDELSKKFDAILDDLCYSEPVNSKGWHDASQCLLLKADVVADRLGLSKGFARTKDFHIPTNRVDLESKLSLGDLIDEQEKEYQRNCEGWVDHIGEDLSVFIRRQWASFSSLRDCFDEIGKSGNGEGSKNDDDDYAAHVRKEIGSLYDKEDYIGWQQAWGGLFVGALRKMARRCMYVSLYLLRREDPGQSSEGFLTAEIAESLGISFYSELMGSQMYGYPMHVMTDHRKRQLAETALACFQFAVESSGPTTIDEDAETRQTWDLLFMMGKCHEKIASTYKKEAFRSRQQDEMSDESEPTRAYERHMQQALQAYAASYKEAKVIDDEGGLGEIHGGGSTHGLTEVFYRLHASRLKCLLWAVSQKEDEREVSKLEALRLTTAHWFHAPTTELEGDTRDRVWTVLVDIVSALAQCRIDQPFFHRSIYRHAQALMWAPVLHDPLSGTADSSLGLVPVTKGHLLRGFNSSSPCANSVEAIVNPLFEKKRPQICAVWVTNASVAQSPFELLNNSVRKYDSLRGKYISAYIATLRLCKRKGKIEALLQTLGAAPRDLPSFFQASALTKGGIPELPHIKDSLLVKGRSLVSSGFMRSAKREANSALAVVLRQEVSPEDSAKAQGETLKAAYACFLRLNCSVDDLRRTRAWKFGQASIPEVDALCQAYLARKDHKAIHAETSNWIGGAQKTAVLKAAIEKCQDLFPRLPKDLYGRRKTRSRSKTKVTDSAPPAEAPTRKRKEPEGGLGTTQTPQTFAVTVPDGLSAGDKFDTTVDLGDGSNKKIRLTVPTGSVSGQKLQFSIAAPASSSADKSPPNS